VPKTPKMTAGRKTSEELRRSAKAGQCDQESNPVTGHTRKWNQDPEKTSGNFPCEAERVPQKGDNLSQGGDKKGPPFERPNKPRQAREIAIPRSKSDSLLSGGFSLDEETS